MRTLAIDTATEACSVALFEDGQLLAGDYQEIGRGHAEKLIPMIAALPDNGQAQEIFVNCGPGSFTGVRIGISAARALALAWQAKISGYQSLSLVAATTCQQQPIEDTFLVAMNGGHGELFVQLFDCRASNIEETKSIPIAVAIQQPSDRVIAGSAAMLFSDSRPENQSITMRPDARNIFVLPPAQRSLAPTPIYGRPPDAEIPKNQ